MKRPFGASWPRFAVVALSALAVSGCAPGDSACTRFADHLLIEQGTLTLYPEVSTIAFEQNGVRHVDWAVLTGNAAEWDKEAKPQIQAVRFHARRTTDPGRCGHMGKYPHVLQITRLEVVSP